MFVDLVKVVLVSGDGGNGIVAFRREKYVPLGGPSGGDGGDGGNIVFKVDTNKSTLLDLRFNKKILAESGTNGKTKKMHGARGKDTIIKVPVGTVIKDAKTNEIIADLTKIDQSEIILSGGKGGRGNYHFATSRNSAPEFAENGEKGSTLEAIIELKILADCGLVGLPSVGKSTLLSVVSKARPEIADYPFTTLKPNLGIVKSYDDSFVMADLPGLIEDASKGKGLGIQFLKHVERCKVLIHVLDMGRENPLEDFEVINRELVTYNENLIKRPMVVAANKMDEELAEENLSKFKVAYPNLEIFPIITLLVEGITPLLARVNELIKETNNTVEEIVDDNSVVYRYTEKEAGIIIEKDGPGRFRIVGPKIDRSIQKNNLNTDMGVLRAMKQLRSMDIDTLLRKAGAQHGDTVIVLDYEFDFVEDN